MGVPPGFLCQGALCCSLNYVLFSCPHLTTFSSPAQLRKRGTKFYSALFFPPLLWYNPLVRKELIARVQILHLPLSHGGTHHGSLPAHHQAGGLSLSSRHHQCPRLWGRWQRFYTAGFQIYTLLLSLSSVGIPNAISKLVSAQVALGHRAEAHRIFRTALVLFFGIGLVCSGALFFGADFIALYIIKMDGVQGTLQALSPLSCWSAFPPSSGGTSWAWAA